MPINGRNHRAVGLAHDGRESRRFFLVQSSCRGEVQPENGVLLFHVRVIPVDHPHVIAYIHKLHQVAFDGLVELDLGKVSTCSVEVFVTVVHLCNLFRGVVYYDQFDSQTAPASDSDLEQFRKLFQEMRAELQDNDCGQWSAEARQWALDMGLITGNGTVINGEPNYMWQDLVTREQFVTVLYRLAQIMGSPA